MDTIAKNIERFLLTNTVWVFFTVILVVSVTGVIHTGQHDWGHYLSYTGKLSLLFAPVLAFCGYRSRLQQYLPRISILLLWIFCFLAYPFVIEILGWQKWIARAELDIVMVRMTAVLFISAELILQLNSYWLEGRAGAQWLKRISLERVILIFMILFAIFYAWIGYFINEYYADEASVLRMVSYTVQNFLILLVYYCFYWINHYFLIARIWKRKGVVYYSFGLIATVVVFYPIAAQLIYWLPMVRHTEIHPLNNGRIFEDINAFIPLLGMLFSIPFILAIRWFRQSSEIAVLAREKSETELNLLKHQINPHFFFNTLNNLYALSLTKDEQTPEVIMQLSELMRYVIYKGKEETVTLEEEVKYIADYVRLQQIRLHRQFDFRFEKEIDDATYRIPPLLFITLVENAFKHGVEPSEQAAFLHIYLKSEEEALTFSCKNSVDGKIKGKAGIGLSNLRRRLELHFPDRHEFRIEEGDGYYLAALSLDYRDL